MSNIPEDDAVKRVQAAQANLYAQGLAEQVESGRRKRREL